MKRPIRAWVVFAGSLLLALAAMLYFSGRVLQLERATAEAQARASLEETVRLALWRMDSAATLMLAHGDDDRALLDNRNDALPSPSQQVLVDPQFQSKRNINEYQQREALNTFAKGQTARGPIADRQTSGSVNEPPAEWRSLEPALIGLITDILPGAHLEPAPTAAPDKSDSRRLATIPARLVVPASALPDFSLPLNTPLRVSLLLAWLCIFLAAGAVAVVLSATLSLSQRRAAFASAVTHELRTPLTTFRMYSEMLASGVIADPGARRQYLQTLVTESDRLTHLIENVLAYARLENRAAPRALDTLSVDQLVEQALPTLRRRADQAGHTLTLDLSDDARSVRLRTDPVAVQQVLLNLVDNACKYAHTDMVLSARATPDAIGLTVSDGGPGLQNGAARAFAAFNKSRTDAVPGIGLGLYLSRQLARNLGGELAHDPTPRLGAAFTLTLPRER